MHLTLVQTGVVKCLHDWARGIVDSMTTLREKCICNIVCYAHTQRTADAKQQPQWRKKRGNWWLISYVAKMSEDTEHICRKVKIRACTWSPVFSRSTNLESKLIDFFDFSLKLVANCLF